MRGPVVSGYERYVLRIDKRNLLLCKENDGCKLPSPQQRAQSKVGLAVHVIALPHALSLSIVLTGVKINYLTVR
jgi:hypothetical protein